MASRLAHNIGFDYQDQQAHGEAKKEMTRLKVQQLAEKRKKETKERAREEVEHTAQEQVEKEEGDSNRIQNSPLPQTKDEEQSKQGSGDLERIPFYVKQHREQENEGLQTKTSVCKSSLDQITLMDGDLDDIGDKVRDTTVELLHQFEKQQKQALVTIQMGLHDLQIQTNRLQAGVGQSSAVSTNLAPGTTQTAKLVRSLDLWVVALPDGALSTEADTDKATISNLKNIGLNLATLPSEFLHTLQAGVIAKLKAREKCALIMINKNKVNNEHIFIEKTSALEAWKKVQERNE